MAVAVRLMLCFTIQTIRLGVDYSDNLDCEKLNPELPHTTPQGCIRSPDQLRHTLDPWLGCSIGRC
jgi:hypothetical protein